MIHLANLRDNDLECVFPSLDQEDLKNYSMEENFLFEIFQDNIDIEIKSSMFDSGLAFENLQNKNQSLINATKNLQSEEEIIYEDYLNQQPFFSGDNEYLDNLDSYFLKQRKNDDFIFCEKDKKLKHEIAGENLTLQEKPNEDVFFPIKTLEEKTDFLNSQLDEAIKLIVEPDKDSLNQKDFEPSVYKLENILINHRKSSLSTNDSNTKTTSVGNKTQTFLGIKTNRSEAPSLLSTNKSFNCAKLHKKEIHTTDLEKIEHLAACNYGRWSDAEHKLFIEALIRFGKNWNKIKRHIKTRNYYQVVQYTTRFFNRIRKFFDISSNVSYDSMKIFRKLIYLNQTNKHPNQDPNCDFDYNNNKDENCKKWDLQSLFLEFISGINSTNFPKFCEEYNSVMSNYIKAFFINEFLILNPAKNKNFQTVKEDLSPENNKNRIDNRINSSCNNEDQFEIKISEKNESKNKSDCDDFGRNKLFNTFNFNFNQFEAIDKLSNTNSKSANDKDLVFKEELKLDVLNPNTTKSKTKLNEENGSNVIVEEKLIQNSEDKECLTCHSKNDIYPSNPNSENCNFNMFNDVENYEGNNSNTKMQNCSINNCNWNTKDLIIIQNSDRECENKYEEESKISLIENQNENIPCESKTKIYYRDAFNLINRSNYTETNPILNHKGLLNNDKDENFRKTDASFFKERINKSSIASDPIGENLYESLKVYFKDNEHIQLKNLNLKLDIEKELEMQIRKKLSKFMFTKDQSPIFSFNPKTNRYEVSNNQGKKRIIAEANTDKNSFKLQSPSLKVEELKTIDLFFSDRKGQQNLLAYLNHEDLERRLITQSN